MEEQKNRMIAEIINPMLVKTMVKTKINNRQPKTERGFSKTDKKLQKGMKRNVYFTGNGDIKKFM